MATLQNTQIEKFSDKATISSRWVNIGVVACLSLLILISYKSGLYNKPVTEELIRPEAFLGLGDDKQFQPVFGLLMLALETTGGSQLENPLAYRLFSIAAHTLATLALFFFARRLTSSRYIAGAIAILFALYPRHHESVFSIGAASHLLMTACMLCSLNFYLKGTQERGQIWLVVSVVLFGLGLLSSEAGAACVAIILAYEIL